MASGRRVTVKKPKQLECCLQDLDTLLSSGKTPDVWNLEQYATPPSIAAEILYRDIGHNDILNKNIVDLGCGCGVLSIGCAMMGAKSVLAIDIDQCSLDILSTNVQDLDLDDIVTIMKADIRTLDLTPTMTSYDVVVMNPPFGTKNIKGIDRVFVEKALELAPTVYSLHKTMTREYWQTKVAIELDCKVELPRRVPIAFKIDRQWKRHLKDTIEIQVDLLKFSRNNKII